MKSAFPGIFILLVMLSTGLWTRQSVVIQRAPAQAAILVSCAQAFRTIMTISRSPWLGFLRRVPRPHLKNIDGLLVDQYTDEFLSEIQAGKELADFHPDSLEQTLGLMEATLVSRGSARADYGSMDIFKRGKLASLLRQLDKPSRFSLESYENIWAEIFITRIGRWDRYKSLFDGDHAKRQAIMLLMQEEIARLGLEKAARKYGMFENPAGVIRRFKNSKLGKFLAVSIFNVPVALGMPPLVLPRFTRPRLPKQLAEDLLDQGLTDINIAKVDDFLKDYSAGRFGLSLDKIERYELIRRTYNSGLGAYFLVLAVWETIVRNQEISDEEDSISDTISDIQVLIDSAQVLQEQGYDIFSDEEVIPKIVLSRECSDLKDCLSSFGDPEEISKNSSQYKECKEFVDPQNKCQQF